MVTPNPVALLEKAVLFKRIGYALMVVGLIFLILMTTAPELYVAEVVVYGYLLLGIGFVIVAVNWLAQHVVLARLKNRLVYCLHCGWAGTGREWSQTQSCPECDSEEVTIV